MQATLDLLTTHELKAAHTKTFMGLALLRATTYIFGGEISMMVGVSPPFTRREPASALLCVMNACVDLCTQEEFSVTDSDDLEWLLIILRRQTTVLDEGLSPADAEFAHGVAEAAFAYVEREAQAALRACADGDARELSFNAWHHARMAARKT